MKKEDFPILYAVIDDKIDGVQKISFVKKPATQQKFVAFSENEQPKIVKYAVKEPSRRLVSGVIMMADTPIFTFSKGFGYYWAVFSKETIEKMAIKFAKNNLNNSVDTFHKIDVDGVTLFESFITDNERGIKAPIVLGDLPDGTWVGTFYVENDDVWKKVLDNTFEGFSLAGEFFFQGKEESVQNSSPIQTLEEDINNLIAKILQKK